MKRLIIFLLILSPFFFLNTRKKATPEQLMDYYKNGPLTELKSIPNPSEALKTLIELREKKDCLPAPNKNNGNYNYNYNYKPAPVKKPTTDTMYLYFVSWFERLQNGQEKILNRLDGIDNRLSSLEQTINFINNKIDSLAVLIVSTSNANNGNVAIALEVNEANANFDDGYTIFTSERYLDLSNNPDEVIRWVGVIKRISGTGTFDPDWFREFTETKTVSDPDGLKKVKAAFMLLGLRVKAADLDYYDEYFFEQQGKNSADIKQQYWRFYNLQR
jgi:hypothetical protein